jgi:hypothetical protein
MTSQDDQRGDSAVPPDESDETIDADGLHHCSGKRRPQTGDGTVEVLTVGGKTERIWQDPKERTY